MTTAHQLNSPAHFGGSRVWLLQHCSYLFEIVWCAAPHLDKIVWYYLLSSCHMNAVLSPMQRDQWTAQKRSFWTYYIWFVVYSVSAQNLPHAPSLSQAFGA